VPVAVAVPGALVAVGVGVGVGVPAVLVAVGVAVGVGVIVAVPVGNGVGVRVEVDVGDAVAVGVPVTASVLVRVGVVLGVGVGVSVVVGVLVVPPAWSSTVNADAPAAPNRALWAMSPTTASSPTAISARILNWHHSRPGGAGSSLSDAAGRHCRVTAAGSGLSGGGDDRERRAGRIAQEGDVAHRGFGWRDVDRGTESDGGGDGGGDVGRAEPDLPVGR